MHVIFHFCRILPVNPCNSWLTEKSWHYFFFLRIRKSDLSQLWQRFMYTAGTPSTRLPENCLCVRLCVHGDDPPSAPLECLQCAQRNKKISSSPWGLCSGLLRAPGCVTVWACDSAYTEYKHIWKAAHNSGITDCHILRNNLLHWS